MPPAPPSGLLLLPGDPVPWFRAATAGNPNLHLRLRRRAACAAALPRSCRRGFFGAGRALHEAQASGLLDDTNACAFVVSIDPADAGPDGPRDAIPGLRVFLDRDHAISRAYGTLLAAEDGTARYLPWVLLLYPLLRVVAGGPPDRLPDLLAQLRALLAGRHAGPEVPAPVLPRVLEPALCDRLIALYQAAGGEDSGFMVERGGRTVGILDHTTKRRRDCTIEDPQLQAAIRIRVSRRIAPEMRKAFQFDPTRIERYIVACYHGSEGEHFRAHRDNTTPGTAHRRFAVTINLNDAFEGGELWFPEFGPRRYRPPAGGAVVFSCSLLHEATPVTAGLRYATLPFPYDDAAAAMRDANRHTITAPGERDTGSAPAVREAIAAG